MNAIFDARCLLLSVSSICAWIQMSLQRKLVICLSLQMHIEKLSTREYIYNDNIESLIIFSKILSILPLENVLSRKYKLVYKIKLLYKSACLLINLDQSIYIGTAHK